MPAPSKALVPRARPATKPTVDADADGPQAAASPRLDSVRNAIGARLRSHRIHRNLSGVTLSKAAGISGAMLSKIEAAERIPSVPVLVALASALGVEIGDLFGTTAAMNEPLLVPAAASRRAGWPETAGRNSTRGQVGHPTGHHGPLIDQLGVLELPELQVRLLRMRAGTGCSPTKPIQFDGFWIDHVVRGEVVIRIGQHDHHLRQGDTLTYRGEVPHYVKSFPAGAAEILAVQGWLITSSTNRIKLDGAFLSPGQR